MITFGQRALQGLFEGRKGHRARFGGIDTDRHHVDHAGITQFHGYVVHRHSDDFDIAALECLKVDEGGIDNADTTRLNLCPKLVKRSLVENNRDGRIADNRRSHVAIGNDNRAHGRPPPFFDSVGRKERNVLPLDDGGIGKEITGQQRSLTAETCYEKIVTH